jgi:hypothetical protein
VTTLDELIGRLNRVSTVTSEELLRAMTASLILLEGDARTIAPHDTRRLAGSITHKVSGHGLLLVGRVGPSVRYGTPVEFGRRAGAKMPPVAALIPWVKRHWTAPLVGGQTVLPGMERYVQATNRRRPRRGTPDAAIRRRAFILARAIARRGIVQHPYVRASYTKNRRQIYENFVGVGARVVVSITGGRR